MAAQVRHASDRLETAQTNLGEAERAASPHIERIEAAENALRQAAHDATETRLKERVAGVVLEPPTRGGRGAEIKTAGHGLSL